MFATSQPNGLGWIEGLVPFMGAVPQCFPRRIIGSGLAGHLGYRRSGVMEAAQATPDMSEQSDEELLGLIQDGHRSAFAELVRRHSHRFYRVAWRILKDQAEAEDMVQNSFLKLWQKPESWRADKKTKFLTWFYRVVTNACLDHLKKKRPDLKGDELIEASRADTEIETELGRKERQEFVAQQVQALPERQRMALTLCFYEGLSNQEAADVMGIKLKALQSLIVRAKQHLKINIKRGECHDVTAI